MVFATRNFPVFTGDSRALTRGLSSLIVFFMLVHERDRQIVLTIGRFGQVTSGQLLSMLFSELGSVTPLYRALERLVERKFISRIERRMVGGSGAGSGQYVYQLGSRGWTLCGREGRYYPLRSVNYHTLAIVDSYVELLKAERKGNIHIVGLLTEPDSWRNIAGADLRPDMHVEIEQSSRQRSTSLWLEIDMGTERPKAIGEKLARYWHAYSHVTEDVLPVFPLVLFLALDDARAKELRWVIERGPEEARALFMVSTINEFCGLLFT